MNSLVIVGNTVRIGSRRYSFQRSQNSITLRTVPLLFAVIFLLLPLGIWGQRAIQNPSLENPTFTPINSYHRISEETLIGWLTTHPLNTCAFGPESCRPIERWGNGFNSVNAASGAGNAFVELNAEAISMIYQQVCMTQGESFTFSFLHRGRDSTTTGDVADFRIGIPNGLPAGSKPADTYNYPILRVTTANDGNPSSIAIPPGGSNTLTTNITNSNATNGWRRYGGRYLYNGPTQVVNMGFSAVSTAGGNVTVGNFIDDWQIQLAPYVEAAAVNTSYAEGSTGTSQTPPAGSRPALRISGNVGTGGALITVTRSGGTAVIGTDFSLTQPFQAGSTINSVTISIPAGTYDGVNTGVFNIPFSTRPNTVIQPHRTVQFTITSVSGNAYLASLNTCGQSPIVSFSHTIWDDDTPTSATVPLMGRVVEPGGRGVYTARITMMDLNGNIRSATTNPFGYFRFEGVNAGETVVLSVSAKRHTFTDPTRVLTMDGQISEVLFVSN